MATPHSSSSDQAMTGMLEEIASLMRDMEQSAIDAWVSRINSVWFLSKATREATLAEAAPLFNRYVNALAVGNRNAEEAFAWFIAERLVARGIPREEMIGALLQLRDTLAWRLSEHYQQQPQKERQMLRVYEDASTLLLMSVASALAAEGGAGAQHAWEDALSPVPILKLRSRLLLAPLMGRLSLPAAQQMALQVLHAIQRHRAKAVIIDASHVPVMDGAIADQLALVVKSSRLLGATVIFTGISAELAYNLIECGTDLKDMVVTPGDLQEGLKAADRLVQRQTRTSLSQGH